MICSNCRGTLPTALIAFAVDLCGICEALRTDAQTLAQRAAGGLLRARNLRARADLDAAQADVLRSMAVHHDGEATDYAARAEIARRALRSRRPNATDEPAAPAA